MLLGVLITVRELLDDVAKHPTAAVPGAVWQSLSDAVYDLGDPRSILDRDDSGRLRFDENGWPALMPDRRVPAPPLEDVTITFIKHLESGDYPDVDVGVSQHGLVGIQMQFKKGLVDQGYADYVAGGRLPEIPKNEEGWLRRQTRKLRRALAPCATIVDSMSKIPSLGFLGLVSEALNGVDHALGFTDSNT